MSKKHSWSKKIVAKTLSYFGFLSAVMYGGSVKAADMQLKYGPAPSDMPALYGMMPVYNQPTCWEIVLRYALYILLPLIIIVLIIVGVKRRKKK